MIEKQLIPDEDQWSLFLQILKKQESQTRIRGFLPSGHPEKKKGGARKGTLSRQLVIDWQKEDRGVYLVVNDGGDTDKEISECLAFFCEWDDRPKPWQVSAWKEFGLPEPTVQVDTGGKSIHSYWVLTKPITVEEWLPIQKSLLEFLEADTTIKNASRVMRLPGAYYIDANGRLGDISKIINFSGNYYSANSLKEALPDEQTQQGINKSKKFSKYEKVSLQEVERALSFIPSAVPKTGQYPFYRNLLWGLIKACRESGGSLEDAKNLMKKHSPKFAEIDQCAISGGDKISAGTFWYWAREHGYKKEVKIKKPPEELSSPEKKTSKSGLPFKPLGCNRGVYYYLPEAMKQVVPLTAPKHNKYHLNELAPLQWWANTFGDEKGRIDWDSAKDALMSACISQGVYSPSRIRGRGAWFDADRVVLHLGNRLVIDGSSHKITKLPEDFDSFYFYESEEGLIGPSEDEMSDDLCSKLMAIAQKFSWEKPASAKMLLGWIVLAPVCGSLDWRPHIWITGSAGTGKTSILKLFIKPLMSEMMEGATGGTTEAGLRGRLKSDAIPVVFDELEQNESKDKQVVQNILSLARIASSEGGRIYKGTSGGGTNIFEIRSMFCVSSINVALVQKADFDRFCILALQKNDKKKDEWDQLEQEILDNCTEENGRRLIARTVKRIPTIRKNAKVFSTALSKMFGRRFGDQYGTLMAGAYSLEEDSDKEITVEEATKYIDPSEWESEKTHYTDNDEYKCLYHILQALIPVEGGKRVSLFELIQMSMRGTVYATSSGEKETDEVNAILGRYGLKVTDNTLAVANSNSNLQSILKDTPWSGTAYRRALRRIPGAYANDNPLRFKGAGPMRATMIPLSAFDS